MNALPTVFALTGTLLLSVCHSPSAEPSPSAASGQEVKLIAILSSTAAQKEKADACRELAHVGTKASLPALVALLDDDKLSHMARYGLETLPGPAVNQALREALPTLKGRQLAGVVASLGVRRDPDAAASLGKLLQDGDPDVANAAARALGDIATKNAVQILEAALANAAVPHRPALCEGLFRCAESLAKTGDNKSAARIYNRLRNLSDAAHQIHAGALRGAILTGGRAGVALLREAIRGSDWILADAAARTAMEMPDAAITEALAKELNSRSLPADRQILILQTLGRRADARALPAMLAATRGGPVNVCLAAIRAVAEINDVSAAPTLADLACGNHREIATTALESLASLPGRRVDTIVLDMVGSSEAARKLAGLELVARRRMTSATSALQKATADSDPKVRATALKQLAEFGGEAELPALLTRLDQTTDATELSALEEALSILCVRIAKPDECADKLIARLTSGKPTQKAALLRVLGSVGGPKSLAAVRTAVEDANPDVRAAALGALNSWPTADAAPALLALARSASSDGESLECLRGYLRWAADADVPAKQRLTMCAEADSLVQRTEEKRLLLAALGNINSPDALARILPFADVAAVREEACVAVVNIAERMTRGRNATKLAPRVLAVLEKVAQTTTNADVTKRAKALLDANK